LNSLEYEEALKFDKRSFVQFYISILKINQILLDSFFIHNDYNSRIIKMFLFFFFFSLSLVVTALFFNDNTLHRIYQEEGHFNFIYQIPQILYSSVISGIINIIIKYLALSQESIIKFKQEKDKENLENKQKDLIKKLKIQFLCFFVLTFSLILFFWYYLACFCGIYINTQVHLIKDTLISFLTSLIYPFGFCLIPGIFRIYALKSEKGSRKLIYKFSSLFA